jgi:thiaminase/transcriptional activator TenA
MHESLWEMNKSIAEACLNHPFVRGLADGSLPAEKFKHYIAQDKFFLDAYAKAYKVAGAKGRNHEERKVFRELLSGVLKELKLHESYSSKLGIPLKDVKPLKETETYTDFLLLIAREGSVEEILSAMTPCMRLYAFLGQEILNGTPPPVLTHPYGDWIVNYGSGEFNQLAGRLESLLDMQKGDEQKLQKYYRHAMQCELNFFEGAWNSLR